MNKFVRIPSQHRLHLLFGDDSEVHAIVVQGLLMRKLPLSESKITVPPRPEKTVPAEVTVPAHGPSGSLHLFFPLDTSRNVDN